MEAFKADQGFYRLRQFEEKNAHALQAIPRSARKKNSEYRRLKKDLYFWEHASRLKADLIQNYRAHGAKLTGTQEAEMDAEADLLAVETIRETQRLSDTYNIHSPPLVHNLAIQVGLSKRGACKHWAEDLLNKLSPIERRYFTAYWAEAHATTMREHNVAALVPKGADFKDGILIDPWRTAGKPYWVEIQKDHYPWQPWSGYTPR